MDNNNYNNGDYSAPQQDNSNSQYNANGQYDANGQYQYNTNGQYDANGQYQYNTNGQYDANGQYQYNTNGQYYANGQYNMNGQYNGYNNGQGPVDANGKPIPNNFGMKLTFSILVTIFLSRIFGILSIVFTCQQNSAYKEGRWDDFKNKKKLSNVFLWIGLVVGVLLFILSIVLFGVVVKETFDMVDYYEYSYSYDDDEEEDDRHSSDHYNDDDEDDDDDDDMAVSDDEEDDSDYNDGFTYGESILDFEQVEYITINGSEVGVPMSVQEFIDITGYRDYDVDVETLDLDAHNGGELVYIDDENGYSLIDIYNGTDDTIKAIDGVIGGIKLDFEYTTSPIQFNYRGITNDSTIDDVLAILGEADTRYDSEYGVELSYYTTNGWVEFDWDEYGDMTSIWIENNGEID